VSEQAVHTLAQRILDSTNGLSFQIIQGRSYSIADQFELLARSRTPTSERRRPGLLTTGLLGPDQLPPRSTLQELTEPQFRDALADVYEFIEINRRIPARVFVGPQAIGPADFLYAMAFAHEWKADAAVDRIPLGHEPGIIPERYVARDTPNLFGGWIIHKEGFRAPKILEIARLQTWTLKPALLKSSGASR
jgi:hypothetical protein